MRQKTVARAIAIALLAISSFWYVPSFAGDQTQIESQRAQDTIIISDVDDTIRISQIFGVNTVVDYTTTAMPFTGLPDLYRTLGGKGVQFAYVSAIPKPLSGLTESFLKKNHFPEGALYARGLQDRSGHKEQSIRKIILNNPGKKIILIGDNGESDSETFSRLQKDPIVGHAIEGAYIHEIFNRPGKSPLPGHQLGYLTAGDLAVNLYQRGLISESEAKAQLTHLVEHLDDDGTSWSIRLRQHKAFPEFADVSPTRIHEIIEKSENSLPVGNTMRTDLTNLENGIVEQRNRWGRLTCVRNMALRLTQAVQLGAH